MSESSPLITELAKLIAETVQQKPTTGEEATEILHKLQVQLGFWMVSQLPAVEQKAVLIAHWGIKEVELCTKCA